MAITDKLQQIRNAVYGRDVREAIAGAIEECYTDVTNEVMATETTRSTLTEQVNTAIGNANQAASNVNAAIENVNAAISDAEAAAQKANTAAASIDAATVEEVIEYVLSEVASNV